MQWFVPGLTTAFFTLSHKISRHVLIRLLSMAGVTGTLHIILHIAFVLKSCLCGGYSIKTRKNATCHHSFMGAALDIPAGKSFSTLKERMNTYGIRIRNEEMLTRFEKAGQTFFELYTRYVGSQRLNQEDCQELFEYVQKSFSAMSDACRPGMTRTGKHGFIRDLTEVLEILTPFLELLAMILKRYKDRTSHILLTEFAIAVQCFKGAVNVTAAREPPYYHL